eukprot:241071_1
MVALLTCLLSMFSYIHVNAYTKSTDPVEELHGPVSGTEDGDLAYESCPLSSPTLVSCGLASTNHHHYNIDGSYPSNGICAVRNGQDGTGVSAVAVCASNDYTCTYHTGPLKDGKSTVACTDPDEIMVSCSPHSSHKLLHGAYVGTQFESTTIDSATLCTAHREVEGNGNGVLAEGICCQYNGNDGYQLDCKTEWGPEVSNGHSSAYCDSGYEAWGCSGYSPFADTLATYMHQWHRCRSSSMNSVSSGTVQAVATCCRLYKEPTPEPTNLPTIGPTNEPTLEPTDMPTSDPTKAPTTPTKDPTSEPTTNNPTNAPTVDPTVNPTADPSIYPTVKPTTDPTMDPTINPTLDPTVDPTGEPTTNNPTNVPTLIPSVTATYEEYDVVTESDDDTSAFESTVYEHNSSGKGNTKASNLLVTYIVIAAVLVSAICIAFIIYESVIRANRRFPTDTNQKAPSLDLYPKAPSLDATRPPGTRTITVHGGEKSIELSEIVMMVKDEEGSNTSDSLYDQVDIDPYHTPIATAGENRMASLPLPALPSDAPNMQSLPLDDGDDEGSDSDGLYVAVVAQTTRMPSLPRKASRMASFPVPELSRDDEASDSDMDVLYGRGKPSKQTSCNSPKLPREASRLPSLPLPELSHDDESSDSNMDGLDGHGKPTKQASCNSDKLPREASRMSHGDACSVSSDSNMDGLYGHGKPTKQTTPN